VLVTLAQLQGDVAALEQKTEKLLKDLETPEDAEAYPKFYTIMNDFSTRAAYEVKKLQDSLQRVEEFSKQVMSAFPGKDDTSIEEIIKTFHDFIEAYKGAMEETKKRVELEEKKRQIAERKAKLEAAKADKTPGAGAGAGSAKPTEVKPEVPSKVRLCAVLAHYEYKYLFFW